MFVNKKRNSYREHLVLSNRMAVVEIDTAKLKPYIGEFRFAGEPGMPFLVSIEKDRLHIKAAAIGDWALFPISETKFIYLDRGIYVTFVKGADGKFDQMKVGPEDSSMEMLFDRKKVSRRSFIKTTALFP